MKKNKMSISSGPLKNYTYTMYNAQILYDVDNLFNDVMKGKLDENSTPFFKEFMQIINSVLPLIEMVTGINIIEEIPATLEKEFKSRFEENEEKLSDEKLGESMVEALQPLINRLSQLETLGQYTLKEQVIVLSVTAYETYLKDTLISLVNQNKAIQHIFKKEINDIETIEALSEPVEKSMLPGVLMSKGIKTFNLQNTKQCIKRAINMNNPFGSKVNENTLSKFLNVRHIIIHNGGRVDSAFKKQTMCRNKIGSHYKVNQKQLRDGMEVIDTFVNNIEKRLDNLGCERIELKGVK
ncbi:MAG: hypothetical protein FP824_04200 [Euryarchaeota archaeon]|nr:hypothetical protein [Euryarchaeota archaeon]